MSSRNSAGKSIILEGAAHEKELYEALYSDRGKRKGTNLNRIHFGGELAEIF